MQGLERLRGGMLVLDPFAGGAPQSEDELRGRVKRVIPDGVADDLPAAELPLDQFLEPATNRQILSRVLRNLKAIYRDSDKPERMLDVLNRMLLVTPDASAELRDRRVRTARPAPLRSGTWPEPARRWSGCSSPAARSSWPAS